MDKEFQRERRQHVVMGNNVSEWEQVTIGVPQGSVLGPLLFFIYINDIPEVIKHFSCKLYADDSKFIAEIKDEQDAINLQYDID
jgi:ribonuclease P/MRP protein subunit RPP40